MLVKYGAPPDPESIKRILIFRIGQLGDTLVALPALWAIRRHFPSARLTFLSGAPSHHSWVTPEAILPPGLIDDWLTYRASESGTGVLHGLRLITRLRRERFDLLIYLAPTRASQRSVRRDLLCFGLAGIRRAAGHRHLVPLPVKTSGQALMPVIREADHLLQRIGADGIPVPELGHGCMDLQLTDSERGAADRWLADHDATPGRRALVAIGPGSKWPSKIWPESRFVQLGQRLINDDVILPIVFGGSDDAALGARLVALWGVGVVAAGELSLRESAAAMSRCRLYVGNDTGTMHLAAAVDVKCVVPFSAQDWPGRWYPYGQGHIVIRRTVPCEACKLRVCDRNLVCLTEIGVDEVTDACRRILHSQVMQLG